MTTPTIRSALLCTLALLLPLGNASPPACGLVPTGCEAWTNLDGTGADPYWATILSSPDGTQVLGSASVQTPNGTDNAFHAYDPTTGHELWQTIYHHPPTPKVNAMTTSPDGSRLFVTGTGLSGGFDRVPIMSAFALDAYNGSVLWVMYQPLDSEGKAITTSPDGSIVYVSGAYQNNYAILALDAATGAQRWASYYDAHGGDAGTWRGHSYDVAYAIARSPDGTSLYVTGISTAPDGLLEYATLALNAATGAQRWLTRAHGHDPLTGANVSSEAYDVRTSPDGRIVYALGMDGVKAYDAATGTDIWTGHTDAVHCRTYWPMLYHECNLRVSPDGSAVYAFSHNDLAAYDAHTGAQLWHDPLRVGNALDDEGRDMTMSPDGTRLYLATPGGYDDQVTDDLTPISFAYVTQAIDTTNGLVRWHVTYGQDHFTQGIAVSPTGDRVFVTGMWYPRTASQEVETVAYPTNLGLDNLPTLTR